MLVVGFLDFSPNSQLEIQKAHGTTCMSYNLTSGRYKSTMSPFMHIVYCDQIFKLREPDKKPASKHN